MGALAAVGCRWPQLAGAEFSEDSAFQEAAAAAAAAAERGETIETKRVEESFLQGFQRTRPAGNAGYAGLDVPGHLRSCKRSRDKLSFCCFKALRIVNCRINF